MEHTWTNPICLVTRYSREYNKLRLPVPLVSHRIRYIHIYYYTSDEGLWKCSMCIYINILSRHSYSLSRAKTKSQSILWKLYVDQNYFTTFVGVKIWIIITSSLIIYLSTYYTWCIFKVLRHIFHTENY